MNKNYLKSLMMVLLPNLLFLLTNASYYISVLPKFGLGSIIITILINFTIGVFIFSTILFSRSIYIILCFIIFCCNCTVIYYKKIYSSHLTEEIVDYIIHSDAQGIRDHLDFQLFLWIFLLAVVPTILLYLLSKKFVFSSKTWLTNWLSSIYLSFLLAIISITNIFSASYIFETSGYVVPYNYIILLSKSLSNQINESNLPKENNFIPEKNEAHKGLRVVLIIGESARYDHFSLNGYSRITSPNLAKINNFVSFTNAYSLATYTSIGVPKIFQNERLGNHTSVIKLMEQNGFKTFWISNHRKHGDFVTDVAIESQNYSFRDDIHPKNATYKYDEALLPNLDKAIGDNSNENIFIVLHAIGSHLNYDLRYPDQFKIYTPICKSNYSFFGRDSCTEIENLTNSYDNSIAYTDYILSKIIDRLRQENAIMIYVSDHGQSLGEDGMYFHGAEYDNAPDAQLHVAMFMWASDKFLHNKNNHNAFLKAAATKNNKITHANIFHSIPHCLGYKKNIDPNMSICK